MGDIKSSGQTREFSTGSHRDMAKGKGRMDLLPSEAVILTMDHLSEVTEIVALGKKECITYSFRCAEVYMATGDINNLYKAAAVALCAVGIDEGDKIVDGYNIDNSADVYSTWSAGLIAVSKHYEEGAEKYGENNWKLGQPMHVLMDSGMRHNCKAIAGITDEPHIRATAWNYLCAIWIDKHLSAMRDLKFEV